MVVLCVYVCVCIRAYSGEAYEPVLLGISSSCLDITSYRTSVFFNLNLTTRCLRINKKKFRKEVTTVCRMFCFLEGIGGGNETSRLLFRSIHPYSEPS